MFAGHITTLAVVEAVAADGKGEEPVVKFLQRHQKRGNAHAAFSRIKKCINPVTYEELIEITNGRQVIASIPNVDEDYDLETLSDFMVELKNEWDPLNLFRLNRNVPPSHP